MCSSQGSHWRKTVCTQAGISWVSANLSSSSSLSSPSSSLSLSLLLSSPVVVVEDEDGGDAAGAHHEHDAAEVHPWNTRTTQLQIYFISIGFRCWDCYGNCGGLVCSGLVSPMRGVVSVMGSMSPTIEEKMVMASMIVTPVINDTLINIYMKQKIWNKGYLISKYVIVDITKTHPVRVSLPSPAGGWSRARPCWRWGGRGWSG